MAAEHILSIYSCQAHAAFALQSVLLFVSSNKLTVCVGSIACVVWLSLFERKKERKQKARVSASMSFLFCFFKLFNEQNKNSNNNNIRLFVLFSV